MVKNAEKHSIMDLFSGAGGMMKKWSITFMEEEGTAAKPLLPHFRQPTWKREADMF